ncbi:hypothetical protein QUF80_15255 [Desulfococcaceae bacterium HSG8]|nr:hypothetical protein [Desulfococcaceae bacterium HSG8]
MLRKKTGLHLIFYICLCLFSIASWTADVRAAPIADAGPDQTVYEDETVTLDASGSTGDGVTYEWTQIDGESVTLSDANTQQPIFTAPNISGDSESLIFQLTVTDQGGLTDSDICVIKVEESVTVEADAGSDMTAEEGDTVELNGIYSDGNEITYEWIQLDGKSVTLSDPNAEKPTFTAPSISEGEGNTLIFQLTVTDETGLTATDTCVVEVIKNPPQADAGPDQTVNEDVIVTLDGSDSTGNDITYQWEQTGGHSVALSDPNASEPTFNPPDVDDDEEESLTFKLTVTDKDGQIAADTCVVEVRGADTPTADAGSDHSVTEGETVTLNGSDSQGTELTYKWRQTAGPSVTLSDSDTDRPTFTAPTVNGDEEDEDDDSMTFELTVTDKNGMTDKDTCVVKIDEPGGWCFINTSVYSPSPGFLNEFRSRLSAWLER